MFNYCHLCRKCGIISRGPGLLLGERVETGMQSILILAVYPFSTYQSLVTQVKLDGSMPWRTQRLTIQWCEEEQLDTCIWTSRVWEPYRWCWSTRNWWEWESDGLELTQGCRGAQKMCWMLLISTLRNHGDHGTLLIEEMLELEIPDHLVYSQWKWSPKKFHLRSHGQVVAELKIKTSLLIPSQWLSLWALCSFIRDILSIVTPCLLSG